jgi:hypothetical protein
LKGNFEVLKRTKIKEEKKRRKKEKKIISAKSEVH